MSRSDDQGAPPVRSTGIEKRARYSPLILPLILAIAFTFALPAPADADFGIADFTATAREADGTIAERAASHPFALEVHLAINTEADGEPDGLLSRLEIDLPPGLSGNPLAVPRCSLPDFEHTFPICPGSTQIGILRGTVVGIGQVSAPLYNLAAQPGYAAAFGVAINGNAIVQRMQLAGTGSRAAIRLDALVPDSLGIVDVEQVLWGIPAAAVHDPERTCIDPEEGLIEGCPSSAEPHPLLTLPASCAAPMRSVLTATSLGPPPATVSATALSRDAAGNPQPLAACESVPFDPRLSVYPDGPALSPSGLTVGLELPQYQAPSTIAAATLSRLRLALPPGLALNPSAGAWLQGCEPAAVGLLSAPGTLPPAFDAEPAHCPPRSRLGALTARSPLIDRPLEGRIYLAQPDSNPFAAPFAIYLVIEDPATATTLKFPGLLEPDPADGRLIATVTDLPPFPFAELELGFDGGPQAPLASPSTCGAHASTALLTPSSAPQAFAVTRRSTFTLAGAATGPCPPPEPERPAKPDFTAGTEVPIAGASTPLLIRLSRGDADQHLGAFDLTLPPGLLAGPAAADRCSEIAIASARAANGLDERTNPSCPAGSAIGTVRVAAGIGPQPLRLDGTAYMAGPYKGAPYSLAVVVPAQVGPHDLGTIVLRVALSLDSETLRLSARSDRLPQILSGIPLELRSVSIELDRPGLIHNPTSCEPSAIIGTATTALGQSAPLSERFQVGGCAALPFGPRLSVRLTGALARNGRPALKALIRPRPGQANITRTALTLPVTELLEYTNIRAVCTQSLYAAGAGGGQHCPSGSRYGRALVLTQLFDRPLEGPLYLRTGSDPRRLPDLVASLGGAGIHLDFVAKVSSVHGLLHLSFDGLPDVPVEKVALRLPGGRRGLLVNTTNLCRERPRVRAAFLAHSHKRHALHSTVKLEGADAHCSDPPRAANFKKVLRPHFGLSRAPVTTASGTGSFVAAP